MASFGRIWGSWVAMRGAGARAEANWALYSASMESANESEDS
jgi:hypothetical protein